MDLLLKRVFDVSLVVTTAPLWLPFMIIVALFVRWNLGQPVLFRQERPGRAAKPFNLFKFRTMTNDVNASGQLSPDDERLTPFGCFLRRSSLDELPELLNVLRGDMSLVGPRPLLMRYVERYTPQQFRRHEVKPGITGWAQVNGRNAISWSDKLAYDVWYVENRSLWLDIKILALTILKVVRREGISASDHATMPEFLGTDRQ